jgi:glycosyltransferase involved in cell wall biosynthesis
VEKNNRCEHPTAQPFAQRIGYIVFAERLDDPIVQSQVLDVICSPSRADRPAYWLIWVFRPNEVLRSIHAIRAIRSEYGNRAPRVIPIPALFGRLPLGLLGLLFVAVQTLPFLGLLRMTGLRLVHCRSYHASLIGLLYARFMHAGYVFDPRSPYVDECRLTGRLRIGSRKETLWESIERILFRRAQTTIVTAKAFRDTYPSCGAPMVVIPNNYSSRSKEPLPAYQVGSDRPIIVYAGSLGHWNNAGTYARFIAGLCQFQADLEARFFVRPESQRDLKSELSAALADRTAAVVLEHVEQQELISRLSECTAGIQLMGRRDVRLSIKVVEYLAAGCPVIVSDTVLGAAQVIADNGLGIVVSLKNPAHQDVADFLHRVQADRDAWAKKCRQFAAEHYSTQVVARAVFALHLKLVRPNMESK